MKKISVIILLITGITAGVSLYFIYRKQALCLNCNVLLITLDALRADHLGSYGYSRNTSPTMDKLAKEGILFKNTFTTRGLTFPAFASLMTSKYIRSHGVIGMNEFALPENEVTLAEHMNHYGYFTKGITQHNSLYHITNFDQGFKEFNAYRGIEGPYFGLNEMKEWLKKNRKQPFFSWFHFFYPHEPHNPPEPYASMFDASNYQGDFDIARIPPLYKIENEGHLDPILKGFIIAQYDGQIRFVDDQISNFIKILEERGFLGNTIVMITSDHGHELFDHNAYFGHEASVYDSVMRVPLIIYLPGNLPRGKVIEKAIVHSMDIFPTILDLTGISKNENAQGKSLVPFISGKKIEQEDYFNYAFSSWQRAGNSKVQDAIVFTSRSLHWKLIYNPKKAAIATNHKPSEFELYDMLLDPYERNNLASTRKDVIDLLLPDLLKWDSFVKENSVEPAWITNEDQKEKKELKEQLKALGYIN